MVHRARWSNRRNIMSNNIYSQNLEKNAANYQQLTPLTLFERSAAVYPNRTAIIHGKARYSYKQYYERCCQLASALQAKGIGVGDTVTVMLSNTPAMLEAHMGIPMAGAVIHSMNTRLDAETIAFQMDHAETKILITDLEFSDSVKAALEIANVQPIIIDYVDPEFELDGERLSDTEYEDFIGAGDVNFKWQLPEDEWDAISLNYTSGTTGNPKGVVYHHRGAALMCYNNIIVVGLGEQPVYLWTLPMFHCNGWCFAWAVSAAAGTHVCLRWVRSKPMYELIADHKVTHICGAPIVMSTLMNAPAEERRTFEQKVSLVVAAAPPPDSVLKAMKEAGFTVIHAYGLTETYGPGCTNIWHPEWDDLPAQEQVAKQARQGVRYPAIEGLDIIEPSSMQPVARDGETMGEVMFRGNTVMKGYLKNSEASESAFKGGRFHTGDLGVRHEDGYIQLKDRSKDIIISGGENISSIEVENTIYKFEGVNAAAVIGVRDEKWGETPCAIVELAEGREATEQDIIDFCRDNMARFKCPTKVLFQKLPRTSTGKIQKFKLRQDVEQGLD